MCPYSSLLYTPWWDCLNNMKSYLVSHVSVFRNSRSVVAENGKKKYLRQVNKNGSSSNAHGRKGTNYYLGCRLEFNRDLSKRGRLYRRCPWQLFIPWRESCWAQMALMSTLARTIHKPFSHDCMTSFQTKPWCARAQALNSFPPTLHPDFSLAD